MTSSFVFPGRTIIRQSALFSRAAGLPALHGLLAEGDLARLVLGFRLLEEEAPDQHLEAAEVVGVHGADLADEVA